MASLLESFLEREASCAQDSTMKGDIWSNDGCFKFISRWLVICGYPNPGPMLPFMYETAREYRVGTRLSGGMLAVANSVAKKVGLTRPMMLGSLQMGDIALLEVPHKTRPSIWGKQKDITVMAFGIKVHRGMWAVRSNVGITMQPFPLIEGWCVDKAHN